MRIGLSVDIEAGKATGPHRFMRRLARALRTLGCEIVDAAPEVYLRFPHHRPRRDAGVDIVRLDGLYLGGRRADRARNRRILRGARGADGVVFQNAFCREAYGRVLGFRPHRWAEILNGADPAEFAPCRPTRVLLANAAWRGSKRLPAMLEAFSRLVDAGVDAELHVTGEPDARLEHPRIAYLGPIDEVALREELAIAAASLHLGWLDWCPNAMVEAVVAGCPVIYTDSGGQPAIGRGAGIAIPDAEWDFTPTDQHAPPPLDVDAVAEAMGRALREPIPVDRPDLDIHRIAEQYLAFFEQCLAARGGRGVFAGTRDDEEQAMPSRTSDPVETPTVHCHAELLSDLEGHTFVDDATLMRWANGGYSTSRHLPTLYSIARGLTARRIVEVGFGRSSFVLARAAHENAGRFAICDTRDFRSLLSDEEAAITDFHTGISDDFWPTVEPGVGFAFLDYFSSRRLRVRYIVDQLDLCLSKMLTDGVIAVHDAIVPEYRLGKALDALAERADVEVIRLPYCYGLGLIRNRADSPAGRVEPVFEKASGD